MMWAATPPLPPLPTYPPPPHTHPTTAFLTPVLSGSKLVAAGVGLVNAMACASSLPHGYRTWGSHHAHASLAAGQAQVSYLDLTTRAIHENVVALHRQGKGAGVSGGGGSACMNRRGTTTEQHGFACGGGAALFVANMCYSAAMQERWAASSQPAAVLASAAEAGRAAARPPPSPNHLRTQPGKSPTVSWAVWALSSPHA